MTNNISINNKVLGLGIMALSAVLAFTPMLASAQTAIGGDIAENGLGVIMVTIATWANVIGLVVIAVTFVMGLFSKGDKGKAIGIPVVVTLAIMGFISFSTNSASNGMLVDRANGLVDSTLQQVFGGGQPQQQ